MTLRFIRHKKPTLKLEAALVAQAERLCLEPDQVYNNLTDLFVALNIYKLTIQGQYKNPDQVQINLIKESGVTGLRIYRMGQTDSDRVLQFNDPKQ